MTNDINVSHISGPFFLWLACCPPSLAARARVNRLPDEEHATIAASERQILAARYRMAILRLIAFQAFDLGDVRRCAKEFLLNNSN